MQEILVVLAIGLAIFFIPRLMNRNASSKAQSSAHLSSRTSSRGIAGVFKNGLPGWLRLVIVVSVLWIAGCTAYLRPWEHNIFQFFCIALAPVFILWGIIWVWAGYLKYRR